MLPHNLALADHLDGIAFYENLYEIKRHEYRSSAYRAAARLFRRLGYEILTNKEAQVYKGVAEKIGKRVEQFARTGTSTKLVKLRARDEARDRVISELLRVREMSIERANDLYDKEDVRSLDDLYNVTGRFALTRAETIYLDRLDRYEEEVPREEIFAFESDVRNSLPDSVRVIAVGPYRRDASAREIHLLLSYSSPTLIHMTSVLQSFEHLIRETLSDPEALTTFRGVTHNYRIVNIRLFREMHYAPALLHMTGSDRFRVDMRERAQEYGLHLNEYRLARGVVKPVQKKPRIKISEADIEEERADEKPLATLHERDIFQALDLGYIIPSRRDI